MELRFSNGEAVYHFLEKLIRDTINQSELVYQVSLEKEREIKAKEIKEKKEREKSKQHIPEPFETKRLEAVKAAIRKDTPYEKKYPQVTITAETGQKSRQTEVNQTSEPVKKSETSGYTKITKTEMLAEESAYGKKNPIQEDMRKLLDIESRKEHKIIGQLFETYWLVEFDNQLYIIDQHAAHEKVLYERTMKSFAQKEFTSQTIYPPVLLTLNMQEEELLRKYMDYFQKLGFEIEPFGGKEYSVTAVPGNLFGLDGKQLVVEILDSLMNFHGNEKPDMITEKIASMSCKAAVKGNQKLSRAEVEKLIDELLTLENPYHCPHGRPTIISMTKYELEKKFKRVL